MIDVKRPSNFTVVIGVVLVGGAHDIGNMNSLRTCFSVCASMLQASKKDCLSFWEGFTTILGGKFSLLNS